MYTHDNHRIPFTGAQTFGLMLFVGVMFSACMDNDDLSSLLSESMPQEVVKTHLSFSFSGVNTPRTRMGEDIVQGQEEPEFRGIQDIKLFAHTVNDDNVEAWKEIVLTSAYPSENDVAQFYADVEVPLNTDKFRFYGEAKKAENALSSVNGKLVTPTFSVSGLNGLSFSLDTRWNTDNSTKAQALADYLTSIATKLNTEGLSTQYNKFIENTAGSSANVFALIRQLYANIEDNTKKTAVGGAITADGKATISDNTITFAELLDGYPVGMPDGTARVAWNSTNNKFEPNTSTSILFDGASLNSYVYPPSLYYYVESGIRTSSTIHMYGYGDWLYARQHGYAVEGVQDYDTSWKHFLDMYEYNSDEKVGIYSHSVALADEISYAVSRLDATIRANSSTLQDAAGRQVHFTASAFPITGILIGNQKQVDYQFEQTSNDNYIIYDTAMPDGMVLSTQTSPVNRTLVLESCAEDDAKTTDKDERTVKIAVEFLNNSGFDFYGYKGEAANYPIISNGTKFYLLAELNPNDAEDSSAQDRVFKKGKVTSVDFVVSSFANAYNVVPDLRNPRLMLGMLANINWQTGIVIPPTEI